MLVLRPPLLVAVVVVALGNAVGADDATKSTAAVAEARALMGKEQYHRALPLLEEALKSEGVEPDVYLDAARCAAKRGRYLRAIELCRTGVTVARAIKPVTDKERTLRKELERLAKESKASRTLRDAKVPKIVHDMVKYLHSYEMLEKSKFLAEAEYAGEGKSRRLLRPDYQGPHLTVVVLKSAPHWKPFLATVEEYGDEQRARARFAAITELLQAQRKRWEKRVRTWGKAESAKFLIRPEPERNRLVENKLELLRVDLDWDIRGGPKLASNSMGSLILYQRVAKGATKPVPGSPYAVRLLLDGRWFWLK